jgi:hypothetical protein
MLACLQGCESVYVKKKKTTRRTKRELTLTQTKHTHIYQKEKERKNGIVDNILSRKQNMKRNGTEQYVNEKEKENVSKSDIRQRGKRNGSEDTRHR